MKKSYIYANNAQILCQRDGDQEEDEYFYVTDRLGSVRQVVDNQGSVVLNYTYSPFGQMLEEQGSFTNNFKFTGQWFDSEIDQYYLRARMYDPVLGRFTSRDPVKGKFNEPRTLHAYLYCRNDVINKNDPTGRFEGVAGNIMTRAIEGVVAGAISGTISGIVSKANGGGFWSMKGGFGSGFTGGAMPAFFGASGLMAQALSGALSSGVASYAEKQDFERAIAHAFGGAMFGLAVGKVASVAVDLSPGSWAWDMEGLVNPVAGSIGGNLETWAWKLWEKYNK